MPFLPYRAVCVCCPCVVAAAAAVRMKDAVCGCPASQPKSMAVFGGVSGGVGSAGLGLARFMFRPIINNTIMALGWQCGVVLEEAFLCLLVADCLLILYFFRFRLLACCRFW